LYRDTDSIVVISTWLSIDVFFVMCFSMSRRSTTVTFEGYRSFALPTFCDEKRRSYIKLWESGKGMAGPILRLSEKGLVEAEFDTTGTLGNTFAVRPNAGIAAAHLDGKTKVIDNFGPDGKHEAEVRLEQPPIPFFRCKSRSFRRVASCLRAANIAPALNLSALKGRRFSGYACA
jgi:hypothetical protein